MVYYSHSANHLTFVTFDVNVNYLLDPTLCSLEQYMYIYKIFSYVSDVVVLKIAEDSLSDLKIDERPVSAIMTVHTLTKDYQD